MPQFDVITLGVQISELILTFGIFYYLNIFITIPFFMEITKFRKKKLQKSYSKISNTEKFFSERLKKTSKSYFVFF
jgi:hypothetical protein